MNFKWQTYQLLLLALAMLYGCSEPNKTVEVDTKQTEEPSLAELQELEGPFTLNLDFSGFSSSTPIVLEAYYWNSFQTIDTLFVDALGNATYGFRPEARSGLWRASALSDEAKPVYFVLNKKAFKQITVSATASEFVGGKASISPDAEIQCLQQVTDLFQIHKAALDTLKERLGDVSKVNPRYYTLKDSLRKQRELEKLHFFEQLNEISAECFETFVEQVVITNLKRPNRYSSQQLVESYELEPAFLHLAYFDYMDLSNADNLGHPVFWQSINEYVNEYAGETQAEHMEGMDILFGRMNNEQIQSLVSEYLVKYYLDQNYEKVARYIASNHSGGCEDETMVDKLLASERYVPGPEIGENAPDFEIPDARGKLLRLHEVLTENELTILYFWKSSCPECEKQQDSFRWIFNTYQEMGIGVVGVSLDRSSTVLKETIREKKLNMITLCDFKGAGSEQLSAYRVRKTPTVYLLDDAGKVVYKNIYGKKLNDFIKQFLASKNRNND